jgi:hypothetical protein
MKTKAIAVTMTLLFSLILSFTIVAEAVEISYDDGSAEQGWSIGSAYKVGIMFTNLPYSQNLLNSVNIYARVDNPNQQLQMYFLDSNFNSITGPFFTSPLQTGTGWKKIDVLPFDIVVDSSFLIGLQWVNTSGVFLGFDMDNPSNNGHSYDYNTSLHSAPYWDTPPNPGGGVGIWMIRADVSAVPLSPSVLLLGSGLLGLVGWRRFRKG